MPRLRRPIYILAHPADAMGCGHHRITRPVEILAKAGYISGRCDMMLFSDERLKILEPDVIVWQRQVEDAQIEAIRQSREMSPKSFQVYELDDCMSAVPDWSPHKAYITHGVDARIAKAVALCDAVTVSTRELAAHMRSICAPGTDIRVAPNMLAREEVARVEEIRAMKKPGRGKLRIGWGGGHSHKGDLDLLVPAMRELHNRVEFVFLGYKPECEVPVEFHQGVPPSDFLSVLAGLELDLIVAPLVDCMFNQCKSNLRLIEAGAIGVPVIASPVAPYLTETPPVVYADDAQDWTTKLTEFAEHPEKFRHRGEELNRWMKRRYIMDDHLEERLTKWLPSSVKPFIPKRKNAASGVVVVSRAGKRSGSKYSVMPTLRDAVESTTSDIVYIRPGTTVSDDQISRLMRHLNSGETASVVPLSNDGGVAGFPRPGQYVAVDLARFAGMDDLCKGMFAPVRAKVSNPAGPVIVVSRRVMELCGYPDLDMEDTEASFVEWGVMAAAKGFLNVAVADTYVITGTQHSFDHIPELLARCQLRYPIAELPPDPLADVRQELELAYHREFYKAPLPSQNATYAEWSALFNELDGRDIDWMDRHFPNVNITQQFLPAARADLSNEWVVFAHRGAVIPRHALYTFAKAIEAENEHEVGGPVLFYADHDYQMADGTTDRHDFKPHRLDRHLLLQRDYLTQICAVHIPSLLALDNMPELLTEVGLYAMLLDLVDQAGEERVVHVPRVLAHLPEPNPNGLLENTIMKTIEATNRVGPHGMLVAPHPRYPFLGSLSYAPAADSAKPKVSVIMPTGGKTEVISPCLSSLLSMTSYPNFEVLVVENGEINPVCHEYLEGVAAADKRVKLLRYPNKYNWSAVNNWAVERCDGEYILLLNDDTRILHAEWMTEMVGAALQPRVGAVGARLLYPHGYIQHVGVVCRAGLSGHLLRGVHESHPGYNGIAALSHQATAVTGACLLVSRKLYKEVGGLNEALAHNFNDVAFCLDLDRLGYRNVVAARAELHHIEGITRHTPTSDEGMRLLIEEGGLLQQMYPDPDPYWNDNLFFWHSQGGIFVSGLNCDVLSWPAAAWEHRGQDWPQDNVLLVGDDGTGWVAESRKGNPVYFAAVQGFAMQILRPPLGNIQPFDIRESVVPQQVLAKLGITKIVVRSILGGGTEVLPFLTNLGVPVEYRAATSEAVCPRLDFKTRGPNGDFVDCQGGWRLGRCQTCITQNGSPFGAVSIAGWRDQWHRFFANIDEIVAPSEEAVAAINEIYPEVEDEARTAAE